METFNQPETEITSPSDAPVLV